MSTPKKCRWCGGDAHAVCPLVKEMEWYPNGKLKRLVFRVQTDYHPPMWMAPSVQPPGVWPPTMVKTMGGQLT